jgi:hypothetical protein
MASSSVKKNEIKNVELVEYDDVIQKLNKWSIPTIPSSTIYKLGMFKFIHKMAIKSMEQTICLEDNNESLNLLHMSDLQNYLLRYKFIHIGCVQIAFKPLTLLGMNSCMQASLRDGRWLDWTSSLMGVVETSLCYGPVYFNVYPNLTLSLTDKNISDVLNLRIQTKSYNFKPGTESIVVIYIIYYKIMNTLAPNIQSVSPLGRTVLFDTNLTTSKVATPRQISWDEIKFPETWTIAQAIPPKPLLNHDIENIIQEIDGTVKINFHRIGSNLSRSYSSRSFISSRPPSSHNTFQTTLSRNNFLLVIQ